MNSGGKIFLREISFIVCSIDRLDVVDRDQSMARRRKKIIKILRNVQLNKSFLIRTFKRSINHSVDYIRNDCLPSSCAFASPSFSVSFVPASLFIHVICVCEVRNCELMKEEEFPVRKSRRAITAPRAYFKLQQSAINQMVARFNQVNWEQCLVHGTWRFSIFLLPLAEFADRHRGAAS